MNTLMNAFRAAVTVAIFTFCGGALAGPGAHGPGGEHLDTPGAHGGTQTARPRIESKSELFELVGYLMEGELSVMINRFETNEPVLNASVEISSGSSKAVAKFHADHGDYAVDDAAFLKLLNAPGEHALVFTIIAGNDSDLLEGTLAATPAQADAQAHGHSHSLEYLLLAGAVAALLIIAAVLWRRRTRRRVGYPDGALS